ncbi:exopolysaccharide biosynthesis glycosyltransferase EpsD [Stigmatella hybrida]|uniref:exopolysaccharide biosynthesis glycosyltransferase EpsD n=1 Tax=Stigmatella hybrida TaxID=394097 RepID=UPI001CDA86D0|nr:exopolysaccharide biosynthesis glycosyltransferase EpsD [Stigmatella hybrida]
MSDSPPASREAAPRADAQRPRLSVVMATYNRLALLTRLLEQLGRQTLPPSGYEVVVVDDGSKEPVREPLEALAKTLPYALQVEVQQNAGAAAARHRGVTRARGDIVLITDDDMQVPEDFLQRHLEQHPPGSRHVILGRIDPDPAIHDMPLFERWYAYLHDRLAQRLEAGGARGFNLYTGNVSFRREDYLAVGGFDPALKQSEDIELGIRLEKAGCRVGFCNAAYVLHGSDHTSFEKWLARAHRYGIMDSRLSERHSDVPQVDPWRMLFEMNALARPLLATAVVLPGPTRPVTGALMGAAKLADRLGLAQVAYKSTSVAYTMEYLRGARAEAGSWREVARRISRYRRAAAGGEAQPSPGPGRKDTSGAS